MVGSAIVRVLKKKGFSNIIYKTSKELDLTDQNSVRTFFNKEKPDYVFLAAALVGGINANNIYRADFLYKNIMIQSNIIHEAYINKVKKLLFFASSCIYPKFSKQPIKESYLLTGVLEQTNEPYAIAKIAGVKMCEAYNKQYGCNFISVMPTNLYGPNDNYDLKNSHVLPALIKKIHTAVLNDEKSVQLWGTGVPKREFLHVDDLAEAALHLMLSYSGNISVNIGTGMDISIKDLAFLIKEIAGFKGDIFWDSKMPDGTPRKLLDVSLIHNLGWKHKIGLRKGIRKIYEDEFLIKGRVK